MRHAGQKVNATKIPGLDILLAPGGLETLHNYVCIHLCAGKQLHSVLVVVLIEDILLVEFVYVVFTHVPGKSYRRWLRSLLLYLCYVLRALINSLRS